MKVLYVSKALVVAAYRDKLRALSAYADVTALVPARWRGKPPEPDDAAVGAANGAPSAGAASPRLLTRPVLLDVHNQLHFYRGAREVLDAVRPDVVHIDEEPYSIAALQFAELCRRRGIPSLFFAAQNLVKRLPPPFGALRRRVFRIVAGGIGGTPAAGRALRAVGYAGPLAVIPQFGVDPARFAPDPAARAEVRRRLGIGDVEFVVGFGGQLVPWKGVDILIRAMAELPDARLLLIGDGPERARLEALAAQVGVAGRLHITGWVPSTEMPRWLPALDVLALPSLSSKRIAEQFGRILVETMACGVPVVGSTAGEIPETVGEGGVIVPEGDAAALAAALREIAAASPDARAELGRRARAWVCGRFTQEHVARQTVEFYHTLLEAHAGAAAGRPRVAAG